MRSSVEPVDPTNVKVTIVVEPDELRPAIDRTVRKLSRQVRVPGFRRGHVPRQVMEARLGRETIVAQAIEDEAVPEFYVRALAELDIDPLTKAKVDMTPYADGQPLEFSATVEVRPEVTLPPHRGIHVDAPQLEVTDADVDDQLGRLRERFAELDVIGRPLAEGDFAQIDLRATHHDTELTDLSRTDALYEVGSGTVVPELDRELVGARKGDILRFNTTLPEGVGEELAGREVTLQVLVKEAKRKVLPELDDDFASQASEFDTLEELRADLRQRLEQAAAVHSRGELESRALSAYLEQVDVALPRSLVMDELEFRANRFATQLAQAGVDPAQFFESSATSAEQLEADLRAQSERAVKAQLVLDALAEAEGLEASDEELEAEVERQARRVGRDPDVVRAAFSGPQAEVLRGDILRSKALALLVEHADVHPVAGAEASAPETSTETASTEGSSQE